MAADYSVLINYICCVVWIMQLGTICGMDTKRNNSGTKDKCPVGWMYVEASLRCFRHFNTELTFDKAKKECEQFKPGGVLAMPKTEEVYKILVGLMKGSSSKSYIGATDREQEELFKWLDGNVLADYPAKHSERGSYNIGEYDCVILKTNEITDAICKDKKAYFCEKHPSLVDLPEVKGFSNQGPPSCGVIEMEDEIWFTGILKNKSQSDASKPSNDLVTVKFGRASYKMTVFCVMQLFNCDPEHPTCRCEKTGAENEYHIAVRPTQQLVATTMNLVVLYKAAALAAVQTPSVMKPAEKLYQVNDEEEVAITAPEVVVNINTGSSVNLRFKVVMWSNQAEKIIIRLSINEVNTELKYPRINQEISIVEIVSTSTPAVLRYEAFSDGGDLCWTKTYTLTFNVRIPAWQLALAGVVMALLVVALIAALYWLLVVSKKEKRDEEDEPDEIVDVKEIVEKKPKQKANVKEIVEKKPKQKATSSVKSKASASVKSVTNSVRYKYNDEGFFFG